MASLNREKNRRLFRLALRREFRLFVLIILGYLCQVCIIPYLQIGRITPLLTMTVIATITVAYGRIQAFWCGAIYGILMEVMLPSRELFQLLLYPSAALVGAILFPDKSMQQLEYERSIGKPGLNRSPIMRTIGCAAVNTLVYEIVNLVYVYLRESVMSVSHITTAFLIILYTTCLTALMILPVRRFLGYRLEHQKPAPPQRYPG